MENFDNIPPSPDNGDNREPDRIHEPAISPALAAVLGAIGIFLLYNIGGSILTLLLVGSDIQNADVTSMRLLTLAGQLLFILVPALLLGKMVYPFDMSGIFRIKMPKLKEVFIFVGGFIILGLLLQYYITIQNYFIEQLAASSPIFGKLKEILDAVDKVVNETYDNLMRATSFWEKSFVIALISVTPAICEEFLFRGFIQKSFEYKMAPFWAALITAIFFGMYHFNPYGTPALIALGLYFGYAAYKSDSIFIPMLLHFLNNFVSVLLYYIIGSEIMLDTGDAAAEYSGNIGMDIILFLLLAGLFAGAVLLINKYYKSRGGNHDMPEL